jgi:hypothetical protein
MEEIMLKLSESRHNHPPSEARRVAKINSTWIFGYISSLIEIILRGLVVFGRRSRPNTTKKKLIAGRFS